MLNNTGNTSRFKAHQMDRRGRRLASTCSRRSRDKNCYGRRSRHRRAHRRQGRRSRRQPKQLRARPRLIAKITMLGEGRAVRLPSKRSRDSTSRGREPQVYAAASKSYGNARTSVPRGPRDSHAGYPLPPETFGGGFIYGMKTTCSTSVTSPDSTITNPTTDPHNKFQRIKEHPAIRKMLEGAKLHSLRRQGDSRRRTLTRCFVLRRRLDGDRRLRRLPQRHASQRRAPWR